MRITHDIDVGRKCDIHTNNVGQIEGHIARAQIQHNRTSGKRLQDHTVQPRIVTAPHI